MTSNYFGAECGWLVRHPLLNTLVATEIRFAPPQNNSSLTEPMMRVLR